MPTLPSEPNDLFLSLFNAGVKDSGLPGNTAPSSFGYGTRQSRLPNNRAATDTRQIIHWLVPEGPLVQMYINPQNMVVSEKKSNQPTRTKGGFVLQYWGEELTRISLSGTTGTSGIEGINVLRDIYRNEQLSFDPYALYLEAQANAEVLAGNVFGEDSALNAGESFLTSILSGSQSFIPSAAQSPPSLASLAFTVEMYHAGRVYRGYFDDFSVTEDVNNMGMFTYQIAFIATQTRGFRQNFLGWHRSATSGPSRTDPRHGRPYSYSTLVDNQVAVPKNTNI